MKTNDMILIGALLFGVMMYSKSKAAAKAAAKAVTPTTPKPAQTGASLTSVAQYWTNLLGPAVGGAVAANSGVNASYVANMSDEQAWSSADAGGWM